MITALSLSGMLLTACNFQGPNAEINSRAGTYEKQQLYQLYAAAGGTLSYDEWLESVKGADGASLLADRRNQLTQMVIMVTYLLTSKLGIFSLK